MNETTSEIQSAPKPPLPTHNVIDPARLSNLVVRFINGLKCSGKSSHTLSAYRNDLSLFLTFITKSGINPGDWIPNFLDIWVDFLHSQGRNSAASVRRALMSTRTFLHFLIKEKVIESSPLLEAKSPRQPTHDLVTITPEKFQTLTLALQETADSGDEKAVRDLALVLMLGIAGLKATEAANLTWGDVFISVDKTNQAAYYGSLIIRKGNERVIPIASDFCIALKNLRKLREALNLPTDLNARLFFGYLNLSRQTHTNGLHRHGIKFVIYEICSEILSIAYNSESLRNYAISNWISEGVPLQRIADLAGYSSLNSLEKFSLKIRSTRIPKRHLSRTAQA